MPVAANRYTLTAANLTDKAVMFNGMLLRLGVGDALPMMAGAATAKGKLMFAPVSITFLVAPFAENAACR